MDNTLSGVIIGAFVSLVPICISTIASTIENRAARKHELRKLDIEIYHREKINALKQYNHALSRILENARSAEAMIAYKSAHDTLVMMVDNETYKTMQEVYKHVSLWHNQFLHSESSFTPVISLHNLYDPLLTCLRKEMNSLRLSSGLNFTPTRNATNSSSAPAKPTTDQETQPPAAN